MHDVPLLVENGMGAAFALVLVVDAPVDVRVTRLVEARGMTVEDARARMAAQADDDARRAAADVWLENAGAAGALREQVERLWHERLVPFAGNVERRRAVEVPTDVVTPAEDRAAVGRRLAARVAVAGGETVRRVEHVGPGAVPGLPAPAVVDLLVEADRPGSSSPRRWRCPGSPSSTRAATARPIPAARRASSCSTRRTGVRPSRRAGSSRRATPPARTRSACAPTPTPCATEVALP